MSVTSPAISADQSVRASAVGSAMRRKARVEGEERPQSTGAVAEMPPRVEWEFGPFRLRACGTLLGEGGVVPLTPKEEGVLRLLVAAEGRRVSKDEIAGAVWNEPVSDASLARAVHTLRRRLGDGRDGACYIRTSYGRGYMLALPVRRVE